MGGGDKCRGQGKNGKWEGDSKEIVGGPSGDMGFAPSGSGVELQERVLQFVIQLDHSCLIAATIAVVRRREHGHHIAVVTPVVALKSQHTNEDDFMTEFFF